MDWEGSARDGECATVTTAGSTAMSVVDSIAATAPDLVRGIVDYLAAVNPTVRRSCLEMTDRHAQRLCERLLTEVTSPITESFRARLRAYAVRLAWVYMAIIDETGQRLRRGVDPNHVAAEVRPILSAILDDLDDAPIPTPSRAGNADEA